MKSTRQWELGDRAGQLAERLAHQPRLQAHMGVAHLAFELRPGDEGGNRIHHQHVDRARTHQGVGNLQRLLAGVRLGDQQLLHVHAELLGIGRVERVLRIDEGAGTAGLLRLRDHMQGQGRLARALRPEDLDHPALGQPADAESDIEAQRARRYGLDLDRPVVLAELHDRALAKGAFDLAEGGIECFLSVHIFRFDETQSGLGHGEASLFHTPLALAIEQAPETGWAGATTHRCIIFVPVPQVFSLWSVNILA